jgi:hypothetical protein
MLCFPKKTLHPGWIRTLIICSLGGCDDHFATPPGLYSNSLKSVHGRPDMNLHCTKWSTKFPFQFEVGYDWTTGPDPIVNVQSRHCLKNENLEIWQKKLKSNLCKKISDIFCEFIERCTVVLLCCFKDSWKCILWLSWLVRETTKQKKKICF